jgi:hypothetical protein
MGFLSTLFGDPPAPPNPIVTAGAQTASNIGTAVTGSYLNNQNQVTPTGNLTYDATGSYDYRDPLTGVVHTVPRWTATQTLTPTGQATSDASQRTALNLANMGEASSSRVGDILGTPFDPSFDARTYLQQNPDVMAEAQRWGVDPTQLAAQHYQLYGQYEGRAGGAPGRADPNSLASGELRYGFGDTGQQQRGFGDAGGITRSYGPADNFSADRARVEESMYQRMNPQLKQDRERLEQQLADQGLQPGTEAYDRAYDALQRQTTDARLAITAKGGEEQQRMMDMAAKQAGFQNAAQQQAYDQLLGRGTFANAAQRDAFTQEASRNQFFNAAKAQELAQKKTAFDATNMTRDKWLQEQYALRAQPLQEITALQSGSQIQQPNFVGGGNSQIANTDIAGIINANFNQQLENYKQNSANVNNIIGGLFGVAGNAARAAPTSDRRAKKNIARVGTVYAAKRHDEPKKLPIYSYEYRDGHEDNGARRHIGPMAQDVEKIDPGAVETHDGIKHIRTRKVLGDILRVA